jgi:predicted nucleic acid-binding protein
MKLFMTYNSNQNSILLDSDFVFALQVENDSSHEKALILQELIIEKNYNLFYLNIVKQEVATLISRRITQTQALTTIDLLSNFNEIFITPEMEGEVWQVFKSFSKKNISFVDCANLYFASKFKFMIASFDTFYPKEFLLK